MAKSLKASKFGETIRGYTILTASVHADRAAMSRIRTRVSKGEAVRLTLRA
jgi:hypothetical protein